MNTSPLKCTILGVCIAVMALSISVPLQAWNPLKKAKEKVKNVKKKVTPRRKVVRRRTLRAGKDYKISSVKRYYVQSAMNYGKNNSGYWDIPGDNLKYKAGQNLQMWSLSSANKKQRDRMFRFKRFRDGYYRIEPYHARYKGYLDVQGGVDKSKNGTNIHVWKRSTKNRSQKFVLRYVGNKRWKIYALNGKVVHARGRKTSNRANVSIWSDHKGPWMEWVLIDATTGQALDPRARQQATSKKEIDRVRSKLRSASVSRLKNYQLFRNANNHGKSSYISHLFRQEKNKTKRLTYAYTLFKQFAQNSNVSIRRAGMSELYRLSANYYPKRNFMTGMMYNKWRKDIGKASKSEKDYRVRVYMARLDKKLEKLAKK